MSRVIWTMLGLLVSIQRAYLNQQSLHMTNVLRAGHFSSFWFIYWQLCIDDHAFDKTHFKSFSFWTRICNRCSRPHRFSPEAAGRRMPPACAQAHVRSVGFQLAPGATTRRTHLPVLGCVIQPASKPNLRCIATKGAERSRNTKEQTCLL